MAQAKPSTAWGASDVVRAVRLRACALVWCERVSSPRQPQRSCTRGKSRVRNELCLAKTSFARVPAQSSVRIAQIHRRIEAYEGITHLADGAAEQILGSHDPDPRQCFNGSRPSSCSETRGRVGKCFASNSFTVKVGAN